MEAVRDSFLVQHVTKPTHYRGDNTPNTLYLIFTNESGMLDSLKYLAPIGKSHHSSLKMDFCCYTKASNTSKDRHIYDKGDYDRMHEMMRSRDWEMELSDKTVDERWITTMGHINDAIRKCIPKRRSHGKGIRKKMKPVWMDEKVTAAVKKKTEAYTKYRQSREGTDYINYRRSANRVKAEVRKAVRTFEKMIAMEAKKNPKAFFNYTRSKMKTRTGISDLEYPDGSMAHTDVQRKQSCLTRISQTYSQKKTWPQYLRSSREHTESHSDITINDDMVAAVLGRLKPNKSPGGDGLHPRVLVELKNEMATPLRMIFTRSLHEGQLPPSWKEANVTPIYKKGKRHIPGSTQHGFIQGRSCVTQLLAVLDSWTLALDEGGNIDTIYLDFAKAFDTVPHQRLLMKLRGYGIEGRILTWIEAFLTDRRQRVVVNDSRSSWADVTSGIPQGSVLGPMLFIIYINDMPTSVLSSIYLFADDAKVYRNISSNDDPPTLQHDLQQLEKWSERWQLRFNSNKCKVMHLGRQNPRQNYTMGGITLATTTSEKDLGVYVDTELTFEKHIKTVVNQANRMLGLIRRSYTYLDSQSLLKLYTSLVRPTLEYANAAWTPILRRDQILLENVQRRATKLIPELRDRDYEDRLRTLKLPSLYYRRARGDMIEAYKFTYSIYKTEQEPLQRETNTTTRGNSYKLKKERCNTRTRANFFRHRITNRWNNLCDDVVTAPSLNSFKSRLDHQWCAYKYSNNNDFPPMRTNIKAVQTG